MKQKKGALAVNAVLNAIKQIFSIIFPLITFPYASRVLGAKNYGKIGFSSSVVSYANLLAGLGIYNYAIREGAKCRNDKKVLNEFIKEVFTLNVISTILAYILLIISVISYPKLQEYNLLIAINSLRIAFNTLGRDWVNTIFEDYKYITLRYIITQSLAIVLMFLLVHNRDDFYIYAITSISGLIAANIMNVFHISTSFGIKIEFSQIGLCKRHLKSVIILFGTAVATQIYINSDITIIGIFLDDIDVGYYSVAVKIYTLVKTLINALLMVAIPRFSFELSQGKETNVNIQLSVILDILIIILLPAMAGIILFSPQIIHLVAGYEYISGSSMSLRILGIALIFACLGCFYIYVVMLPRNMEKQILYISIISAAVNLLLNIFLVPYFGICVAAASTVISEFFMFFFGYFLARKFFVYRSFKGWLTGFLGIIIVLFSYISVNKICENDFVRLFTALIMDLFIYGIVVVLLNKKEFRKLFSGINKQ